MSQTVNNTGFRPDSLIDFYSMKENMFLNQRWFCLVVSLVPTDIWSFRILKSKHNFFD